MFTNPTTQQIQWQDIKVRSEVDTVFEIARQKGWKDCEVFGHGDMITQPLESMGWKLIPADLYEYSIPPEGVDRVLQVINAGVRIQGVIIADDERKKKPLPAPARPAALLPPVAPARPATSSPPVTPAKPAPSLSPVILVLGLITMLIFGLWLFIEVILAASFLLALVFLPAILVLSFDPKLVVLVDDGKGGTVWISLLTWYD